MTRTTETLHETFADIAPEIEAPKGSYLALLSLTALGVVYGDIGTSPLYALRECFHGPHAVSLNTPNILGVLSLILWSLILVISIKYLVFVVRADNKGEGGILALAALASPLNSDGTGRKQWVILLFGIFGAALLYGDGLLTPAISVLGAMEGLSVATPSLEPFIVPIALCIIVILFGIQKFGTAGVGRIFGPMTLIWFSVIGILGLAQIVQTPSVIEAVNPIHAISFFIRNGFHGFLILGSVFLVVTGGEAIYADMGHFGIKPIRIAWFALVLPSLILNYFGQGALLMTNPEAASNPFYNLAPTWALFPLLIIATLAAVIASQAVISGAFSLTMQAVQLGLTPRIRINHTSSREYGQIYIPFVNWALMLGCIIVVLEFRTSSNLAGAYGIAVTSTMLITTALFFVVARTIWGWSWFASVALCSLFAVIDIAFFSSNVLKILDGGWFPLALAVLIAFVMVTWRKGRSIVAEKIFQNSENLEVFLRRIRDSVSRVPGTAIFMSADSSLLPRSFSRNLEHNKVVHENVVFVTVKTRSIPYVQSDERVIYESLGDGFHRVKIYCGFMEEPNVPDVLSTIDSIRPFYDPIEAIYFMGRDTIVARLGGFGKRGFRGRLFAMLAKNGQRATSYFGIPPERVVELGAQIEI